MLSPKHLLLQYIIDKLNVKWMCVSIKLKKDHLFAFTFRYCLLLQDIEEFTEGIRLLLNNNVLLICLVHARYAARGWRQPLNPAPCERAHVGLDLKYVLAPYNILHMNFFSRAFLSVLLWTKIFQAKYSRGNNNWK